MKMLNKWWPFRRKSQLDVTVTIDDPTSAVNISDVESNVPPADKFNQNETPNHAPITRSQQAYERDLSLGGAVMIGLGAKRLLLPTLLLAHPILFTVTASTTAVTGFYYVRSFWNGMTSEEKISGEAITGTVGVATLALGSGGVPALTSIWLLNLGGYLRTRTIKNMPPEEQLAEEAVKVQVAIQRAAWFLNFASLAVIGASVGSYVVQHNVQLAVIGVVGSVLQYVSTSPYGPLLYIGFFSIQPPFFFSESILTVVGGFLFGPVWGFVYAMVGDTGQAMFSYLLGRYFGPRILDKLDATEFVERYGKPMKENPFETILTMRLLIIPQDIVSCLSGTLQVSWKPFLLATALGSIPTTASFVLFGSSITASGLAAGAAPHFNRSILAASGAIFVSSIAFSRYLKRELETETEVEAEIEVEIESPRHDLPGDLAYLGGT